VKACVANLERKSDERMAGLLKLRKKTHNPASAVKFESVAKEKADWEDFFAWFLTVRIGLRLGEVAGLKWGDLTKADELGRVFKHLHLNVERQIDSKSRQIKTPKCGSRGAIELSPEAYNALEVWRTEAKRRGLGIAAGDFMFPRIRKSPSAFSKRLTHLGVAAGLEKSAASHSWRHTCFTFLSLAGVASREIQRVARHTDIGVTQKYIDLTLHSTEGITAHVDRILDGARQDLEQVEAAAGLAVPDSPEHPIPTPDLGRDPADTEYPQSSNVISFSQRTQTRIHGRQQRR
jgi:integrase